MVQQPLPPAPGVAEVKASYLQDGQILQNTFHVHKAGVWATAELDTIGAIYEGWEISDAKALRSASVSLNEIRVTDLSSATANYITHEVNPAIPGTDATQVLPQNVTFAVQAGTGKRGRGQQGRIFWIGLAEDMTNGSTMVVSAAGDIVTALNNLKDQINGGTGGVLSTLHRRANGLPLNPATSSPILTWGAADLTTDSQKNRLPNHRRHKRPTP